MGGIRFFLSGIWFKSELQQNFIGGG